MSFRVPRSVYLNRSRKLKLLAMFAALLLSSFTARDFEDRKTVYKARGLELWDCDLLTPRNGLIVAGFLAGLSTKEIPLVPTEVCERVVNLRV